jgi:hypothetical protein
VICVTHVGRAEGSRAVAAVLACAGAEPDRAALLIGFGERAPRPTLVASGAARGLEERLVAHLPDARVASRGQICRVALPAGELGLELLAGAAAVARDLPCLVHVPPPLFNELLDRHARSVSAVLLRADLADAGAMTALVVRDLIARGVRVRVAKGRPGWFVSQRAALGMPLPTGASFLPVRLVDALLEGDLSHPCYIDRHDPGTDAARAAQQERRDHASAGSR